MLGQWVPRSVVGAVVLVFAAQAVGLGATTQFDFSGNLSASIGPGTLSYWNDTATAVEFGTASSFGLPALPGGDATVMKFNAFTKLQGLLFETASSANGGGALINQYTMIWDLLVPNLAALPNKYFSFYQTDPTNSNDGDFFIRADGGAGDRGIGIGGQYHGFISDNTWYRIGLVVDAGGVSRDPQEPTHYKYIDGIWPSLDSNLYRPGGIDSRWGLQPAGSTVGKTLLFADESTPPETGPGYISCFYFTDRMLTADEIYAFGGPDADGVLTAPATHAGDANRDGKVDDLDASILAANWQRSGGATWEQADFNADGNVNDLDASILAANWQYGVGSVVPEPGTLVLLAGGLVLLLLARRRG